MVNRMEKFLEVIFKKQVIGTAITILVAYIAFSIVKLILEKVLSRNKSEYDKKRKRTVAELLKNIIQIKHSTRLMDLSDLKLAWRA